MDPLVELAPAALLAGVLVREGFRKCSGPMRAGAALLASLAASLWLGCTPHSRDVLVPATLYLGFVAGAAWDWRSRVG